MVALAIIHILFNYYRESNKLYTVDNVVKDTLHISVGTGNFSGTKVVLCKVKKGDHVWIQTSNSYGTNYFHVSNAAAKCSFTGMVFFSFTF
jgi:hypothetical protein